MKENIVILRKGPIKDKVHNKFPGIRISDDAAELLQDQVDLIVESLISLSKKYVDENSRKTIMSQDVEKAFSEFTENKVVVDKLIDMLTKSIKEIEQIKENSTSKYFEV